jgi:hypothetical protein
MESPAKEAESMSTGETTNRPDQLEPALRTLEPAQYIAARAAGFPYVLMMAAANRLPSPCARLEIKVNLQYSPLPNVYSW